MFTLGPIASLALFFLCGTTAEPSIVLPQPQRVVETADRYPLPATVTIAAPGGASQLVPLARRILREHSAGAALTLSPANDAALGTEGYRLRVTASGIFIAANGPAGLFYGLQTLDQLLPAPLAPRVVAGVDITDWPRYRWRGIHLDVSRHFFAVSVVERFIDVAARYKLNVFHWHLTDDQGWRIAISRYPRLTAVGGCRAGTEMEGDATEIDATRYCGFYSQAQIRAVVAYARERFVTVVPEIEMPGHAQAAIAAYPRLGCDPQRHGVRETWGVSGVIFCPSEYTFTFLENVLREVMALFPGRFVHVGGDEVPKAAWQHSADVRRLMRREHLATVDAVQGYFDRRIERFLAAHGRRAIGWDDILQGGTAADAAIMSWHGADAGAAAARRGIDAVMTPDGPLYFDAYQGDPDDEPQAIGGLATPQMVYDYEPAPGGLTPQQAAHVIGVQGNVWSEYIAAPDYLFYMLLPRMLALAEIAWHDPQPKQWSAFEASMGAQLTWLGSHGYTYRIPNPAFTIGGEKLEFANVTSSVRTVRAQAAAGSVAVTISSVVPGAVVRYTTDGSAPTAKSPAYTQPLSLMLAPGMQIDVRAIVQLPDGRISTPSELMLSAATSASNAP